MSRTFFALGPSPYDEDCLQMGVAPNEECRAEVVRYVEQLNRVLPIPSHLAARGVRYGVRFFPYESDAGGYYEAVIHYDDDDEEAVEFVFNDVEVNLPANWDAQ